MKFLKFVGHVQEYLKEVVKWIVILKSIMYIVAYYVYKAELEETGLGGVENGTMEKRKCLENVE